MIISKFGLKTMKYCRIICMEIRNLHPDDVTYIPQFARTDAATLDANPGFCTDNHLKKLTAFPSIPKIIPLPMYHQSLLHHLCGTTGKFEGIGPM